MKKQLALTSLFVLLAITLAGCQKAATNSIVPATEEKQTESQIEVNNQQQAQPPTGTVDPAVKPFAEKKSSTSIDDLDKEVNGLEIPTEDFSDLN